jgi:hypothetical protein
MITYPIGLLSPSGAVSNVILITVTPTTGFTAGITLTFITGTIKIDWKDGSPVDTFVSGVEKTHTYASAGTYIAEISGDTTEITSFIADNSRITFINNLNTGLNANTRIFSNLYSGELDFTNSPVKGSFNAYLNSGLTNIVHASSGNEQVTTYFVYQTGLNQVLDLSNVPISTSFRAYLCTSLPGITFASSGNGATSFNIFGSGFTSLDFSNVPFTGFFLCYSCPSLSSVILAASGHGTIISIRLYSCTSLGVVSFSTISENQDGIDIQRQNCGLSATDHDNQLIDINSTGWINGSLSIITGNTARTSASDAAYNNLIANGWTIT